MSGNSSSRDIFILKGVLFLYLVPGCRIIYQFYHHKFGAVSKQAIKNSIFMHGSGVTGDLYLTDNFTFLLSVKNILGY